MGAAIQGAVEQSARHWLQTQLCVGSNPAQPVLNPLRTYLFNQMSNNNYANPDWASYVSSVGQAVELLTVGLGQDLTQSIANMVSEVGRFYIYRAVAKDPGLAAIVNQQQMLELNQIAQNGNALATKIEQFQQHRAQQMGVAPQMQPNGQNQWGRGTAPGQFGGYNQAVQPTGGFQFGNLSPQTAMVTPQQSAFQQPTIGSKDIRVSGASVLGQIETQPMVAQQLAPQPVQQPAQRPAGRMYLQVGAFENPNEADNLKARLALLGVDAKIQSTTTEKGLLHRVRIGPLGRSEDVDRLRAQLKAEGMNPTPVKAD